ncbi:MAG TPA: 3-isopropylmalate dehydratase small subunit [Methanothrix sp.]|nr:3-isopropylmalate dehydratase small subunit [Methanothrix sp.]HOK58847.1 3-isopropylmalate dehydratase small subunit [Methanothrix sp.]HOL42771.1 3-isopropylmalate dehydratase small subunit [Methanothrix sp.]HPO89030.1 3-isopropylmalate dehydratase small subunit [Methanothrix sp.]
MGILARAWKFGNDIDTDVIIPGRYLVINDPEELAKHLFEGIRPEFAESVRPGDVIVAGTNFGCGSSREHAPLAIKAAGVEAVVARSFARIFFRNSINIGLPLLICADAEKIDDGDSVVVDISEGIVQNISKKESYPTTPLPPFLQEIVRSGGLLNYTKKQVVRA